MSKQLPVRIAISCQVKTTDFIWPKEECCFSLGLLPDNLCRRLEAASYLKTFIVPRWANKSACTLELQNVESPLSISNSSWNQPVSMKRPSSCVSVAGMIRPGFLTSGLRTLLVLLLSVPTDGSVPDYVTLHGKKTLSFHSHSP